MSFIAYFWIFLFAGQPLGGPGSNADRIGTDDTNAIESQATPSRHNNCDITMCGSNGPQIDGLRPKLQQTSTQNKQPSLKSGCQTWMCGSNGSEVEGLRPKLQQTSTQKKQPSLRSGCPTWMCG